MRKFYRLCWIINGETIRREFDSLREATDKMRLYQSHGCDAWVETFMAQNSPHCWVLCAQ